MTIDQALSVAENRGAFSVGFYGDVKFEIKDGTIKTVVVLQTYREASE